MTRVHQRRLWSGFHSVFLGARRFRAGEGCACSQCVCVCVCLPLACLHHPRRSCPSPTRPFDGLVAGCFVSDPLQPPAWDKGACWCEHCYDSSISSICSCVVWLQHWHCEAFTILRCCQRVSAGARTNSCAACIEGSIRCCCCLGQLRQIVVSYCCGWSYCMSV